MASIHGGGNYRSIMVQTGQGVQLAYHLQATDPDPTQEQLDAIAYSYALSSENHGVQCAAFVIKEMRPGPLWSQLDNDQYLQLGGIGADGQPGPIVVGPPEP
jgi:hypothetical protein